MVSNLRQAHTDPYVYEHPPGMSAQEALAIPAAGQPLTHYPHHDQIIDHQGWLPSVAIPQSYG